MQKSWVLVGLLALSGCAENSDSAVAAANASDPACASAAMERSRDAAINGYDTATQIKIREDSYKSCLAWVHKATLVDNRLH